MKPIETEYKGYRFRSRLEARWAIYFDTLGLRWEYELEGFNLGDGVRYLPDFWLPDLDMWAEVKATAYTSEEVAKVRRLAEETEQRVWCLVGPPSEDEQIYLDPYVLKTEEELHEIIDDLENVQAYTKNAQGHFVFMCQGVGNVALAPNQPYGGKEVDRHYGLEDHKRMAILHAVATSRGARFEFGECG